MAAPHPPSCRRRIHDHRANYFDLFRGKQKRNKQQKENHIKTINMSRRIVAIAAISLLATAGIALAAVYTYKCPKCGNIQSFDRPSPGVKCPRDGWIMTPQ